LGDYYIKIQDFDNAILYYQQITEQFPGSTKINHTRYHLAQAWEGKGDIDKAIQYYKLIDETIDKELLVKAQLSIAEIFSKELKEETAIETYQKIIKNSPEFSRDAYLKIIEIYKNNRNYNKALETLETTLASQQGLSKLTNAEIQFYIGDINETLDKSQEAVQAYLRIPYLFPDEKAWAIKAYLRIGRIFENTHDWENARMVYHKIIEYGTDEAKFAEERLNWINHQNALRTQ
jgi:tetratricopeptide (TPR) repeat protein